jgi:hypothetical protein
MEKSVLQNVKENKETLDTYRDQYMSILDEYKKSYVTSKTYPSVSEYNTSFSKATDWLNQLSSNLFVLTNTIETDIERVNNYIASVNNKINIEKNQNETLVQKYQQIVSVKNGSSELFDNSKYRYNVQYISNWNIFIGIFLISFLIKRIFAINTLTIFLSVFFLLVVLYLAYASFSSTNP